MPPCTNPKVMNSVQTHRDRDKQRRRLRTSTRIYMGRVATTELADKMLDAMQRVIGLDVPVDPEVFRETLRELQNDEDFTKETEGGTEENSQGDQKEGETKGGRIGSGAPFESSVLDKFKAQALNQNFAGRRLLAENGRRLYGFSEDEVRQILYAGVEGMDGPSPSSPPSFSASPSALLLGAPDASLKADGQTLSEMQQRVKQLRLELRADVESARVNLAQMAAKEQQMENLVGQLEAVLQRTRVEAEKQKRQIFDKYFRPLLGVDKEKGQQGGDTQGEEKGDVGGPAGVEGESGEKGEDEEDEASGAGGVGKDELQKLRLSQLSKGIPPAIVSGLAQKDPSLQLLEEAQKDYIRLYRRRRQVEQLEKEVTNKKEQLGGARRDLQAARDDSNRLAAQAKQELIAAEKQEKEVREAEEAKRKENDMLGLPLVDGGLGGDGGGGLMPFVHLPVEVQKKQIRSAASKFFKSADELRSFVETIDSVKDFNERLPPDLMTWMADRSKKGEPMSPADFPDFVRIPRKNLYLKLTLLPWLPFERQLAFFAGAFAGLFSIFSLLSLAFRSVQGGTPVTVFDTNLLGLAGLLSAVGFVEFFKISEMFADMEGDEIVKLDLSKEKQARLRADLQRNPRLAAPDSRTAKSLSREGGEKQEEAEEVTAAEGGAGVEEQPSGAPRYAATPRRSPDAFSGFSSVPVGAEASPVAARTGRSMRRDRPKGDGGQS
uniref:Uncharacterized protein n=1 Tax=Chromera velia CCMP2878 TaxID=1169474 RepID=A0A0G4HRQ0_9ALVE|eukprot:Cvel_30681.t1-p1 / transcript=Cvel_30681.t1 / gene=Cvel_30681 / organism=Chromera_velia_CCMP2878 / gene_product=hypothetical protein / transcript_product=hypothetical protein / location=Cvel_scaffold4423:1551-9154(+) / protein_length=718 / sequence_SO=supercontig / SO=protein_coding / is_pseudo=false